MKKKRRTEAGRPIQYQVYIMNMREWAVCFIKNAAVLAAVSYLFYDSPVSFVIMLPYLFLAKKKECQKLKKMRQRQLKGEFKEGMQALSSALDAGYSVENAFAEASRDLQMIYPQETYITLEFRRIVQGIRMSKTAEQMLEDFAERSDLEEIRNFAEIFAIAKKSGGNLLLIVRSAMHTIREKMEVQNEIETMMAGKQLEQKVMSVIPFGILAYVRLTSGGFLDVMYRNVTGIVIMSICLCVYLAAVKLADKIVSVEV